MANKENKEDRSAFQPSIFEANPERERKINEFPPGTPISLKKNWQVHAEHAFKVEKLPGQKWAGLSAFKILDNTLVSYHKDWEGKKYFHLTPNKIVGIPTTKTDYRPKKLR